MANQQSENSKPDADSSAVPEPDSSDRVRPSSKPSVKQDDPAKLQKERLAKAYAERNTLAMAFAKMAIMLGWEAGRAIDPRPRSNWGPDWWHILCVRMPNGQLLKWHMSPSDLPMLQGLAPFPGSVDAAAVNRHPQWIDMIEATHAEPILPQQKPSNSLKSPHSAHENRTCISPSANLEVIKPRVKASYLGPRAYRVEEFATFQAALSWLIRNKHTVIKDARIDEPGGPTHFYTPVKLFELAVAMDGQVRRPSQSSDATNVSRVKS